MESLVNVGSDRRASTAVATLL